MWKVIDWEMMYNKWAKMYIKGVHDVFCLIHFLNIFGKPNSEFWFPLTIKLNLSSPSTMIAEFVCLSNPNRQNMLINLNWSMMTQLAEKPNLHLPVLAYADIVLLRRPLKKCCSDSNDITACLNRHLARSLNTISMFIYRE